MVESHVGREITEFSMGLLCRLFKRTQLTAARVASTKGDEEIEMVDFSSFKPRRIPTPPCRELY